jgi:hypothetical protein
LPFVVGPVTVEIDVVAKREASAKFGAKFFAFLDTGVEGKAGTERTHKLTLTLTPGDPTRRGWPVACGRQDDRPATAARPAQLSSGSLPDGVRPGQARPAVGTRLESTA